MDTDTRQQLEKRFYEKFVYDPPPEKHESGGTLLRPFEWRVETTIGNVKLFLLSTAEEFYQKGTSDTKEAIEKWVKGYIKYSDEEVMALNKDLPSNLQEESLYKSQGMRKVISDLLSFLTHITDKS